jgi:hypothetical protein
MTKTVLIIGITLLLVCACSDDGKDTTKEKLTGDHVWKEQTQAIDKAKAAQGLIEDATVEQRKIIDEQAQ